MRSDFELEIGEDKPLDPSNALEKAIRLDRRHSNFEYLDSLFKYDSC